MKTHRTSQSCLNCYFFLRREHSNEEKKALHKNDSPIGFCCVNPPQPFYEMSPDNRVVAKPGRFPIVVATTWCGMWDAADDAKA